MERPGYGAGGAARGRGSRSGHLGLRAAGASPWAGAGCRLGWRGSGGSGGAGGGGESLASQRQSGRAAPLRTQRAPGPPGQVSGLGSRDGAPWVQGRGRQGPSARGPPGSRARCLHGVPGEEASGRASRSPGFRATLSGSRVEGGEGECGEGRGAAPVPREDLGSHSLCRPPLKRGRLATSPCGLR